jgi:predicted Zn-dependent protease
LISWQGSVADVNELLATAYQAQREGRWTDAAALFRDVLWRTTDHPDWGAYCASYCRALLESGEKTRALNLLITLVRHHPDRWECCSNLALAYSRTEAYDRAGPVWHDVLSRFPERPERRWWLPIAAHAWLELGQLDQAEQACREAIAASPESPWSYAILSGALERRYQWEPALEMVERALDVCKAGDRGELAASKVRILGEMGRVHAARAFLAEELGRAPDSAPVLVAAAHLASAQGPVAEAEERWNICLARCPDSPDVYIGKAWLQRHTGLAADAEDLLRQCCGRWPDLASPWRALAETCAQRRNTDGARQAWAEALRVAPFSIFRLWAQCAFLGACGAREEAEALLASSGAAGNVLWRGRFEYAKAARELDAALACLAELRKASPTEATLAYAEAEIRSWRQQDGDLEEAARILEQQREASPSGVRTAELLVRVLVMLGRPGDAADVLAQVPGEDGRQGLMETRVWSSATRGDWPAARATWDRLASHFFLPALHLPKSELRLLGGKLKRGAGKGVLVVSMLRNELPRLPAFLEHHRKLGVSGFILIDNGSQDGSLDYLAAQPDTVLYSTVDSYAQSQFGIRWLNQVIDMHGHGWVLHADADERLVFPGSEHRPVGDLTRQLSARGEQIVPGVMIDMFPRRIAGDDAAKHEWFDPLRIRPSVMCPFIEAAGGVRRRLFGTTVALSKAPLINAGAGVRYLSSHTTTPGPVSAVRAALLHYHLNYLFDPAHVERLKDEVVRGEHSDLAVDRRRSLAMSKALRESDLTGPDSQRYAGTDQLLRLGLIATTEDFEARFG